MMQFSLKLFLRLALWLTLGLLILSSEAFGATLSSSVDRNPIKINQTLTLTVQYDEQIDSSNLDLTELAQDFEILANVPSSNSSISIVNGQTSRQSTTSWRITLAAKKDGVLTIPAFSIAGSSSSPIAVQVNSLSATELAAPQPLSVSLTIEDADNVSIKPGEQIILALEISAAANVSNLRGNEFKIEGADIEVLGQQNGQRLENGVARQVVIVRYALFPKESGQIEIPSQTFTGTVGGRRSFFDSFSSGGQQVRSASIAQTITVEPQPSGNGKTWFPANNVSVESSWSGDVNQIRVGEPITRSITITAIGQNATVIPPFNNSSQATYKSYKDQPQLESTMSTQGVTGIRIESEAIVPSASGELTLAEQRISWWDNLSDQWREAVLPEETLIVLPAAQAAITNNNSNNSFNTNPLPPQSQSAALNNNSNMWWKIATIGLSFLCLIQFYFLNRKSQPSKPKTPQLSPAHLSETNAWKELQQALKDTNNETNVNAIRPAILNWGSAALPDQRLTNLQSLANLSNSNDLKETFLQLEQQLYSSGNEFNKSQLALSLNEFREKIKLDNAKQHSNKSELAPLYPD